MTESESKRGAAAQQRLLTAAQELFWEQGVSATTPRQVLQRSGVGQGSLYHHFPTKHDLARTAIDRTSRQTLDAAAEILDGEGPARERLRRYLTRHRDALAGCRVGRLTSDPAVMSDAELHQPVRGYFAHLLDLLTAVITESGAAPEVASRRAMTVVAVIQGGYVLARAQGDPTAMEQAVTGLADLLDGDEL